MKYPLPFVCVVWDDAWKDSDNDVTHERAIEEHRPTECHTAGWVLRDDDKGIMLAGECSPNGTYRSRTFVHRALIKEVIPVPLLSARTRKPKTSHTPSEIPATQP